MFKEETMPVLQKLSIINEEESLTKSLCGAYITLIQKPDRGITRKDTISLINIVLNILNKIVAN